ETALLFQIVQRGDDLLTRFPRDAHRFLHVQYKPCLEPVRALEELAQKLSPLRIEPGQNLRGRLKGLELVLVENLPRRGEDSFEFEIGEDGFANERPDVELAREIVGGNVKSLAATQQMIDQRGHGLGRWRVAKDEVLEGDTIGGRRQQFATRGFAVT